MTRLGSSAAVCAGVAGAGLAVRARHRDLGNDLLLVGVPTVLTGIGLRRIAMLGLRRQRPPVDDWLHHATGYSFPSGHSTNAAMASVVVLSALRDARGDLPSGALHAAAAVSGCYTAAVGTSRIYLGVHWPTDVVAGWTFGLSWSLLARRLGRRARSSFSGLS